MTKTGLALLLAGGLSMLAAQQAAVRQSSAGELYERVRARVLADIARLPNYTCVQTVTRRVYRGAPQRFRLCDEVVADRRIETPPTPDSPRLVSWDRLRLDVAIADKHEVFSWVGASRFEDGALHDLVGSGHTSTGDFGPFLLAIFSTHPAMQFQGEQRVDGRRIFEYAYDTSKAMSNYRVRIGSGPHARELVAAYSGTILLDPETGDIYRVTAISAALPEESGYCQTANVLTYGRAQVGGTDVLTPVASSSNAIDRDGDEFVNATSYSGCREYVGESVLRFDDPAETSAEKPNGATAEADAISSNVPFEVRIVTPIESKTSAVGDPVEAVLRSPIRGLDGATLVPGGAHIHGRITRFAAQISGKKNAFEVGIEFLSIDSHGKRVPFRASPLADARRGEGRGSAVFKFPVRKLHLTHLDGSWVTAPGN